MSNAKYQFLPWYREGVVTALGAPVTGARAALKVNVKVSDGAVSQSEGINIQLLGPGDVTGFDPRQVIRTEPANLAIGVERNYFPVVEFDRPDFPWLFTPQKADEHTRQLRPWICLVAVPKAECKLDPPGPNQPLPVLTVSNAKHNLPDLNETVSWAYVQVCSNETNPAVKDCPPEQTLSRLVCPRLLAENTDYYACVVPTYAVGRQAGLGQHVENNLADAWKTEDSEVVLPVYYHWEFKTGKKGDFESLVWRLMPRKLEEMKLTGRRVSVPSVRPGGCKGEPIGLEGALQAGDAANPQEPPTGRLDGYLEELQDVLDAPDVARKNQPAEPLVAPPIYGAWHAARFRVPRQGDPLQWLRKLNLDVRYRIAAGLGTYVVQQRQEALMAAAWEQAGEIERANQALRQAQMAREAARVTYGKRLGSLPMVTQLIFTAPVHTRLRDAPHDGTTPTVAVRFKESRVPTAALSPAFRRLTRQRGPLGRRVAAGKPPLSEDLVTRLNDDLVTRLNDGDPIVPLHQAPAGTITMEAVFKAGGEPYRGMRRPCEITPEMLSGSPGEEGLVEALREQQRRRLPCDPVVPPPKPPLWPPDGEPPIVEVIVEGLDPDVTIAARWGARIVVDGWDLRTLEPIMIAPEFPTPMYDALVEVSHDWILPGIQGVPPDTVAALETNPRFIEAYMVGLNHEMGRELLWRGFPTDQRGTYFRQFWDPAGYCPPPTTEAGWNNLRDLKTDIHEWLSGQLGSHIGAEEGSSSPAGAGGSDGVSSQVVLLIRGELLRRYPNTIIYMARARWETNVRRPVPPGEPDFEERYPLYRARLDPDLTLLRFDLDATTARGKPDPGVGEPGYFFVIQEQPTEPRFGLDEDRPGELTFTWRDLSWRDVHLKDEPQPPSEREGYIKLALPLSPFVGLSGEGQKRPKSWSAALTSAELAYITLQTPFRIAIHADDMLS